MLLLYAIFGATNITDMRVTDTGSKDTRSGFGVGLLEIGQESNAVVGLCADLTGSLKMDAFQMAFPDRFFQCGVAEANMIGVAAGLATGGKIPFASTFANFATGRVFDQIRQSVCYSQKNVKICASHAGLTLGEDGATHQILEDIGLMKMLPHMTVLVPCDYNQTRLATKALLNHMGPCYLRFGRPSVPNFTPVEDPDFRIGGAQVLHEGHDAVIFACGHLVWPSLQAAYQLADQAGLSVAVVNVYSIKPLYNELILDFIDRCKCAVVAEEHQRNGGLGDSIAQLTAQHRPTPLEFIAVNDKFGESGKPHELLAKYGLGQSDIVAAVERVIKRK
jgi:transketolase